MIPVHQGGSATEIAETLAIGVLLGATLAIKSVRHAFAVMDALSADTTTQGGA